MTHYISIPIIIYQPLHYISGCLLGIYFAIAISNWRAPLGVDEKRVSKHLGKRFEVTHASKIERG
jgi:hypothetical protein